MFQILALALLFPSLPSRVLGFKPSSTNTSRRSIPQISLSARMSVDEYAPRIYDNFAGWSDYYGLKVESCFELTADEQNDWSVMAGNDARAGDRLLFVPRMLILSSKTAQQKDFPSLVDIIQQHFEKKGSKELVPQFFLFLKVLKEYELGDESPYFPWFDALPRRFSTAICFDDFEMQCLPPFVGSLARLDRINFGTFQEALQLVDPEYIRSETISDINTLKWAFNVVFTRCWSVKADEVHMVPAADLFNHASEANVQVKYDEEGNCSVHLNRNVQAGESLNLSYGNPTNPSRFLSTFGFLDQSPPATFCKIMAARPTKELKNLGYDFTRMVFYVEDGAIAEEVWDVVLYSLLENRPAEQQKLYHAHMTRDRDTKVQMHAQYLHETLQALLLHVDKTLMELQELADKMQAEGPDNHPHLILVWHHNEFVRNTFLKVKTRLDNMLVRDNARREQQQQTSSC